MPSKAIVVLPSSLSGEDAIDVLMHLHGFTPGYASADDLGVYKIEAQMAAAGKELIGILPQGSDELGLQRRAARARRSTPTRSSRPCSRGWRRRATAQAGPRDHVQPLRRRPADSPRR